MNKEKTIKNTISIKPSQIVKAEKIGQKIGKTYKKKGSVSGAVSYLIDSYKL